MDVASVNNGTDRPRSEVLQSLPTLAKKTSEEETTGYRDAARRAGIDFLLELKLATADSRYWLCTQGVPQSRPGVPNSWVIGYVTPEYLQADGTWGAGCAYGPQSNPWHQSQSKRRQQTCESRDLLAEERIRMRTDDAERDVAELEAGTRKRASRRRMFKIAGAVAAVVLVLAALAKTFGGW